MDTPVYVRGSDGWWTSDEYETRDEAIRAALDELEEGDTIKVHNAGCAGPDDCDCNPQTWTY